MKIFLDTNILIDDVIHINDNYRDTLKLLGACYLGYYAASAATFSFTTVHYLICEKYKALKSSELKHFFDNWASYITFIETSRSDLESAFSLSVKDYEDALQALAAERAGADYIITWNVKDYKNSPIPAITPTEFLQKIHLAP